MAGRVISTVDELQEYLSGVAQRADHHADSVAEIMMAIAGCIVLYKDAGSELRVMERLGETKNVLWMVVRGERYALSYNHPDRCIDVREGSVKGDVLDSFDNESTTAGIIEFFRELASPPAGVT